MTCSPAGTIFSRRSSKLSNSDADARRSSRAAQSSAGKSIPTERTCRSEFEIENLGPRAYMPPENKGSRPATGPAQAPPPPRVKEAIFWCPMEATVRTYRTLGRTICKLTRNPGSHRTCQPDFSGSDRYSLRCGKIDTPRPTPDRQHDPAELDFPFARNTERRPYAPAFAAGPNGNHLVLDEPPTRQVPPWTSRQSPRCIARRACRSAATRSATSRCT